MDILIAQVITIVIFFFSMLGSCLVPLKLVARGRDYTLGISLANCLSAGVFVATFFIGLLPQVRLQFQVLLYQRQIYTRFPVTEFVVFWGFFLAIFADQFVTSIRNKIEEKNRRNDLSKEEFELKGTNVVTEFSGCHSKSMHDTINSNSDDLQSSNSCHGNGDSASGCHDDKHQEDESRKLISGHSHGDSASGNHGSHHHHHHHHNHSHDITSAIRPEAGIRVGILLLSLGVHSLFEGMTLGLQTQLVDLFNLFIGVLIHECLVAFAIGVSIANTKMKLSTCVKLALLISSTIPVGQILGICIGGNNQSITNATVSAVLQAVAAGTFIHVTFLEIIPEGLADEEWRLLKIFFLCLGFAVLAVIPIFADIHDHKVDNKQVDYLYWVNLKENLNLTQENVT